MGNAKQARDDITAKLQELEAILGRGDESAGTMAGRVFRARRHVMNEDYRLSSWSLTAS